MRMGKKNNRAKKSHVLKPPLSFQVTNAGNVIIRVRRSVFEKVLLPAASAGTGAFLIAGYYCTSVSVALHQLLCYPMHTFVILAPQSVAGWDGTAAGVCMKSKVSSTGGP